MEPRHDSKELPVNRLVRDRRRRQASSPEEQIASCLIPEMTAQAAKDEPALAGPCYTQHELVQTKKRTIRATTELSEYPDCYSSRLHFVRVSVRCTVGGDERVTVHVGHQIGGILHEHTGLL